MDKFDIEKILPTSYADIWRAVITIRTPETISDFDVNQNATLDVKFTYAEHLPVAGLLEAAVREAERLLASATSFLSGRSAKELQADVQSERDAREAELNKPLDFSAIFPGP